MRIKTKEKEPEKKQEDWDFDFSAYEQQEEKLEKVQDLFKDNKPRITNLRSRYSPSQKVLEENLTTLRIKISTYAIKVAQYSNDINDLWNLYSCLDEYWAIIHDIYGSVIINQVYKLKTLIKKKLEVEGSKDQIDKKLHEYLLFFRNKIYMLAQRSNLNLEVDVISRAIYDKAKKGIEE